MFIYAFIHLHINILKAFAVSKFDSETTFLYQLFKDNSNFTVLKLPGVTRWLSTYVFHSWSLQYAFDSERPVP